MGERQQAPLKPALTGPSSMRVASVGFLRRGQLGRAACGLFGAVRPGAHSSRTSRTQVATVFSCTRKTKATCAKLWPSMTARMARKYLTWRNVAEVLGSLQVALHFFTVGGRHGKTNAAHRDFPPQ